MQKATEFIQQLAQVLFNYYKYPGQFMYTSISNWASVASNSNTVTKLQPHCDKVTLHYNIIIY